MNKQARPRRPSRKNADESTWCLYMQGSVITLKQHAVDNPVIHSKKGRFITTFTPAARMRMLQMISRIDWTKTKGGLFLTLTLPDECWPLTPRERTVNRLQMFRDMENYLGEQFPALWRCEWKPRLTGARKGELMPHWHAILFGVRYIPAGVVRHVWARILGYDGLPSVDVQRMTAKSMVQVYICKYAAKLPEYSSLDYVLKVNNTGRHWGIHRRALLPMKPQMNYLDLSPGTVARLRRIAMEKIKHYDPRYDAGFTLFGPLAEAVLGTVMEIMLDSGVRPE